jgi:LuxR family maltose regulon positive regulatory protein
MGNAETRLTVVAAPAGWGKTTLLTQWAHDAADSRRVAWVSLDESDDEPVRFWTYLVMALQTLGLGAGALAALGGHGAEPVDVAVPTLLNELESTTEQVVLVLDDYHLLTDHRVHESVEFLLTYAPTSLRLVLAGRSDPPLPLARMRARGELTEIRASDLAFSSTEARHLLSAVGAVGLDADTVHGLRDRTEGWAAGLQLTALAVRDAAAPSAAADAIRGDDRHILDYFTSEVLVRLPPEQRDLLVRTSMLENLSGPLCDAALQLSGSAATLLELDRSDVFITCLDGRGEWFRCHRLFRDALRHQLDPVANVEVLARAADWFLAKGYLADAVRLRITAGDHRAAADMLRSSVPWFLERGGLSTHLHLGDQIDPAVARSDPGLCLALAWAAGLSGRFPQMGPWLHLADPLIDEDLPGLGGWHSLQGASSTLRAVLRQAEGDVAGGLVSAERAVHLEDDPGLPGYVVARLILGHSLLIDERADEAVPVLDDAWCRAVRLHLPPLLALQAASVFAQALLEAGQPEAAGRLCDSTEPAVRQAEKTWGDTTPPGIARIHLVRGRLALQRGDVVTALSSLRRAVTLSRTWANPSQLVMSLTRLADAELAGGNRAAARAALAEAREAARSDRLWPVVLRNLDAAETRIGRGEVRAARRAGRLVEELTDRELSILRVLPSSASQREIGAAMFLSINTVKGYTKSLYRKLDVATRQDAVARGRELGLI